MTTDRDDYVQQVINGAYGLLENSWSKTKLGQVYKSLSKDHIFEKGFKEIDIIDTPNPRREWEDVFQAKVELEFQLTFLHKRLKDLSIEGQHFVRKLIILLDEAHSLIGNALYQDKYKFFYEDINSIGQIINKQTIFDGLIKELIIMLENISSKNSFLNKDIQIIKGWSME